jgi:NADH-quinone oxidoreductase subunit G
MNLLAGNDEHTTIGSSGATAQPEGWKVIVPSNDSLFTSGTLGRYSNSLNSVIERDPAVPQDSVTADK